MSGATPTREVYWNVPNYPYMYALESLLVILLGIGIYVAVAAVRKGKCKITLLPLAVYAGQMAAYVWGHGKIREKSAGYGHMAVFYGFIILAIGTTLIFIQVLTGIHFLKGR